MKLLAVILSMLTLLLSTYPCCQEEDSCSDVAVTAHCGDDHSEEVPNEKEMPCSPFYTCGNCPGFTIIQITLVFNILESDLVSPSIPYIRSLSEDVHFLSLKPPRSFEV